MTDVTVASIKDQVDAVDLIGQTVQLKKAGRTFKGLCPFHTEKTPSFTVWPESGTWICFGCGERGDVLSFLMKRDRLDFREALEQLAHQVGVALPTRVRENPADDEE